MSRIEAALAKLRMRERAEALQAEQPARLGRVGAEGEADAIRTGAVPVSPSSRAYGGKPIIIDFGQLHARRMLAPDSEERKLADEFRLIKRPLLRNAARDRDPRLPRGNLLMVASALAGEGKTFTCINLCLSLAREQDWTVVLVDADCAKPHLTKLFGAEDQPGLTDLLRNPSASFESYVMPTNVANLSLLPAGKADNRAAELFSSDRMTDLCETLSASNSQRIIVFDSSPLLLTPEASILSAQVGQMLLVVHAHRTPQKAVLAAQNLVDHTKAIGLLLNQADPGDGIATYGEYYGFAE